jgi:putative copper export protein
MDLNLIFCKNGNCTLNDLISLAQNLITAMVIFSTFLAVIAFAYAGFILLTSGGSESEKTKAKSVFTKVLIGYLWILGAWLLVYTITSVLIDEEKFPSLLGDPSSQVTP